MFFAKCFVCMHIGDENGITNEAIVLSDWFKAPCDTSKL